jgi:hypothetical protein
MCTDMLHLCTCHSSVSRVTSHQITAVLTDAVCGFLRSLQMNPLNQSLLVLPLSYPVHCVCKCVVPALVQHHLIAKRESLE